MLVLVMAHRECLVSSGSVLATLGFCVTFLPLAAANILSGTNSTPSTIPVALRVFSHLGLLALLIMFIAANRRRITLTQDQRIELLSRLFLLALLLFLVMLSVSINHFFWSSLLRSMILAIFMINLLLLLPIVIDNERDLSEFTDRIQLLFVYYAVALVVFSSFLFLSGTSPYFRLGYPLIPGVFAYFATIALLISVTTRKNDLLMVFFLVAVLFSGSRSAMGFCLLAVVASRFRATTVAKNVGLLLVLSAALIIVVPESLRFLSILFSERGDFSSGRLEIWNEAVRLISDRPLLGYGMPQLLENVRGGQDLAAHNTLLDLTMTYGVVFACFAYIVWFLIFFPRKRHFRHLTDSQHRSAEFYKLRVWLFLLVLFKSMVTNTFWTNMGDAATLTALFLLLNPLETGVENQGQEGEMLGESIGKASSLRVS